MAWILEYRSNNVADTIILVNDVSNVVRSRWDATAKTVSDFADCAVSADEWEGHFLDGEHSKDFGELVAVRNGYDLTVVNSTRWDRAVGFVRDQRRQNSAIIRSARPRTEAR